MDGLLMYSLFVYSLFATIALIGVGVAMHKRNQYIKQKSIEYANKHRGGRNE